MEDSLLVLAEGLTRLACGAWRGLEPDLAANCRQELPWQAGTSLYNYLNSVDTVGEQLETGPQSEQQANRHSYRAIIIEIEIHFLPSARLALFSTVVM